MKTFNKILKWITYFLAIPVFYLIISLILTAITIEKSGHTSENNKAIFLNTNGVHLEVIIPKSYMDTNLLKDIVLNENEEYISFGWGDENFYINTPTWNDLTFKNAFRAVFLKGGSLLHLTRYKYKGKDWVEVKINTTELDKLNQYIHASFKKDDNGNKIILKGIHYATNDNFYKAIGSYSPFKTCNTWVNSGFKKSGLRSCYWTPFDFGLISKYE